MNIACLLILAFAVSLDSFTVGITYGIRKVKIPHISIIIITLASAIMILLSMQIGVMLSQVVSPYIAKLLGSIILIIIGVWVIIQVLRNKNKNSEYTEKVIIRPRNKEIYIEFKKIGLVIQILKTPMKADIDHSGIISPIEAVLLGIALSLDAFGAGLGAALVGFRPLGTALLIAGMSGSFIILGLKTGFILSKYKRIKNLGILPGLIMIIVGVVKIF